MIIRQISVFLENRQGQLAEITSALAEHKVDLRALNIAEAKDYGVARLIADDPRLCAEVLSRLGYILHVTPVVTAVVPDAPGGLHQVLSLLAREEIDITYMYSLFGGRKGRAYMIFRVDDPQRLDELLTKNGLSDLSCEELGIR